eukprot:scaffold136_cov418-Prasinococcus_capsulatus_cf.AAC.6
MGSHAFGRRAAAETFCDATLLREVRHPTRSFTSAYVPDREAPYVKCSHRLALALRICLAAGPPAGSTDECRVRPHGPQSRCGSRAAALESARHRLPLESLRMDHRRN